MRQRMIFRLGILLLLMQLTNTAHAQQGAGSGAPDSVRSEMLVSTKWLADHLNDPNVVVVHVADTFRDYQRGHIPGARYLAMNKIIVDNGALSSELPTVEQLQKVFSEVGIGDNTRVVIYATNWFPNAARAYYTLDYMGHGDKTALLDGGIEAWLGENRPVTSEAPKIAPTTFTPHVHENVRALFDEVKGVEETKPGEEKEQIIDSRPKGRYTSGHLSGAANVYWKDTLVSDENPVFQPVEKLRELYAGRGIVKGKKIVTYCEVGLQASHGYFLAKYLGYEAAMYDGSYQEWTAKTMPVVKGEDKK